MKVPPNVEAAVQRAFAMQEPRTPLGRSGLMLVSKYVKMMGVLGSLFCAKTRITSDKARPSRYRINPFDIRGDPGPPA